MPDHVGMVIPPTKRCRFPKRAPLLDEPAQRQRRRENRSDQIHAEVCLRSGWLIAALRDSAPPMEGEPATNFQAIDFRW